MRALVAAALASVCLLAACAETRLDLSSDPTVTSETARRLAGLPLIEVPALKPGHTLVVLYTGDNGWATFDQRLSDALAASGTPVVGVSSLRYFLIGRSPDEGAKDLAAIIDHYSRVWNRDRVVLVGYSYGADTLPLIAQALPDAVRPRVKLLTLISPAAYGDLTFRGASWFDLMTPDALPVAPALASLKGIPVLCIRADHDPRAACAEFTSSLARAIRLPGGHHYVGEEASVAQAILAQPIGAYAAKP